MTRVLLVDDDPDIRLMVSVVLSREADWEVVEAEDVEEGIRAARENAPDVVLLDLMLGERSGVEVLERLRADPSTREIPVLFLTGKNDRTEELLQRGADGVLTKPFDPERLADGVREALGR